MNVPLQQEELTMRLRRICGRCEYGDEGEEGGREDRVACTLIDDSVFGRLIELVPWIYRAPDCQSIASLNRTDYISQATSVASGPFLKMILALPREIRDLVIDEVLLSSIAAPVSSSSSQNV